MTVPSLEHALAERGQDPAVWLMAETVAALRADPAFDHRPADAAGGALLTDETPVSLDAGALDAVLARIETGRALDASARARAGKARWADEIAGLPSPLREAALDALDQSGWRFLGFGLRGLRLRTSGPGVAELMRVEPGVGVAHHDHDDDELTLIITGGYHDGHAHYGAGDVSLARPDFVHAPKADLGAVCYLLAVTYGPARFRGAFALVRTLVDWLPAAKAPRP